VVGKPSLTALRKNCASSYQKERTMPVGTLPLQGVRDN
jgi:hypothetical protein